VSYTGSWEPLVFTGIKNKWFIYKIAHCLAPPLFFLTHTHVHPNQMVVPLSFSKLYFSQIHKLSQQKWIFSEYYINPKELISYVHVSTNEGRISRSFSSCLCIINSLVKKKIGAIQWLFSKQTLSLININCCRSACAVYLRSDCTHSTRCVEAFETFRPHSGSAIVYI
jgi:hypothetical protein